MSVTFCKNGVTATKLYAIRAPPFVPSRSQQPSAGCKSKVVLRNQTMKSATFVTGHMNL